MFSVSFSVCNICVIFEINKNKIKRVFFNLLKISVFVELDVWKKQNIFIKINKYETVPIKPLKKYYEGRFLFQPPMDHTKKTK